MIYYKTRYEDDPFYPVFSHPDWLYPEERPLRDFPLLLDIETTNACNSKCIFCARKLMQRKTTSMPFAVYKAIVDEGCREQAKFLRIHGWGEPLLHPDVVRHVQYASDNGVTTRITTNGTMIVKNPDLARQLVDAGVSELLFSMQGLAKDSYEEMRVPLKFENYIRSLEIAYEAREKAGTKLPYISVITSIFGDEHTPEQIDPFMERFKPLADKIGIDFTHMTFLEKAEDVSRFEGRYLFEKVRRPCVEVLIKTHINSNGDILICGNDYDGKAHRLGNLATMTIKEAWHSNRLNRHRRLVREEMRHAELPFCDACYDFTNKYDALKKKQAREA